jgi:pimeloyl-ACP methyl ester carboxylesterase
LKRALLLAAIVLSGCLDAPTSSNPASNGSDLSKVPTGRPDECPLGTTGASGTLPGSGALFLICVPPGTDPDTASLVVYAHGSVPPQQPLALPNDQLGGVPVAQLVTDVLGFAYATTSYRENGLIVVDAEKDLQRLVAKFRELIGPIGGKTYGVGASEGGLIVTLATERHPELFDGTLALCAPIGDFQREINYFDDFRLAFDVFFGPGTAANIDLGNPIDIPSSVIATFTTTAFQTALGAALLANPIQTAALLTAADIPVQPRSLPFVYRLLAYNVLFTNDAQETLGGQPYDNVAPTSYDAERPIAGLDVPSFEADQAALSHLAAMYETSGRLKSPLVTLFNADDPIIPSWHETTYADKVDAAGASEFLVAQISSSNFGHCEFSLQEALAAFGALSQAVNGTAIAPIP